MKSFTNLRFWENIEEGDFAGHKEMSYDINKIMKNPSILPDELLRNEDPLITTMLSTGKHDMNGIEIFESDLIQVITENGIPILVECCYGSIERNIIGIDGEIRNCIIQGFYYKIIRSGNNTLPIKENYKGVTDYEIFNVVGNKYENPELLVWG